MTDIYMVETRRQGRWAPSWPFMTMEAARAKLREVHECLGHDPALRIMVYRAEPDLMVTEGVYACDACDATYKDILEMDTDLPWLCPPCARDHDAAEVSRQEEAAAKIPDPEPEDFSVCPDCGKPPQVSECGCEVCATTAAVCPADVREDRCLCDPMDSITRPVPERDGHAAWAVDRIERGLGT